MKNIKLARPTAVKRRRAADGTWQGLKDLRARLAAEGSLVNDTLGDMETDEDFQAASGAPRGETGRVDRRRRETARVDAAATARTVRRPAGPAT